MTTVFSQRLSKTVGANPHWLMLLGKKHLPLGSPPFEVRYITTRGQAYLPNGIFSKMLVLALFAKEVLIPLTASKSFINTQSHTKWLWPSVNWVVFMKMQSYRYSGKLLNSFSLFQIIYVSKVNLSVFSASQNWMSCKTVVYSTARSFLQADPHHIYIHIAIYINIYMLIYTEIYRYTMIYKFMYKLIRILIYKLIYEFVYIDIYIYIDRLIFKIID